MNIYIFLTFLGISLALRVLAFLYIRKIIKEEEATGYDCIGVELHTEKTPGLKQSLLIDILYGASFITIFILPPLGVTLILLTVFIQKIIDSRLGKVYFFDYTFLSRVGTFLVGVATSAFIFIVVMDHFMEERILIPKYFLTDMLGEWPNPLKILILTLMSIAVLIHILFFVSYSPFFFRFKLLITENSLQLLSGLLKKKIVAQIDLQKPFSVEKAERIYFKNAAPWKRKFFEVFIFSQDNTSLGIEFLNMPQFYLKRKEIEQTHSFQRAKTFFIISPADKIKMTRKKVKQLTQRSS